MTGPARAHAGPKSPSGQSLLEFQEVGKTFLQGKRRIVALDNVSYRLSRGRVTGLIGPDGSGKTTLMRLSAGLLTPDTGRVRLGEIDVAKDPLAAQRAVGYMPQSLGVYEDLSVQQNLDLFFDLHGVPFADRKPRLQKLVEMTRLGGFSDRLAGRLSGGMKQKLGLACALVRSPGLLLLDEPTVGVDPVSRRELWAIVDRLVDDEDISVFLSTAYLDEAERCAEVLLLHRGRVIGGGPPQDVAQQQTGRTYWISADIPPRRLQDILASGEKVVDAVVHGEGVRVVMEGEEPPDPGAAVDGGTDLKIETVPPRFEDGYVARLKSEQEHRETDFLKPEKRRVGRDGGSVIRADGLRRKFGDFYAVKNVSFEVDAGEVFGLLGANGAGKSTTFKMLCGLLPASGGEISVAGLDLRKAAARARSRIGYMSQQFSLYGNLDVSENLDFFSRVYGLAGRRRRERTRWALTRFQLESRADTVSARLPLGYKQRLALACALMHDPDILFLDEPTSGVDPLARRGFWSQINALAEGGVTVMVTTHFMEEAEYCDRLAVMSAGEILAIGSSAEIKREVSELTGNAVDTIEEAFIGLLENKGDYGKN